MMEPLTPAELWHQWEQQELTVEMAIGQILRHLCKIQTAFEAETISLYRLKAEVDSLVAQSRLESPPQPPQTD